MSCRYLTEKMKFLRPEIGGPITPETHTVPVCALGRDPGVMGWPQKCENTGFDGPCWYWQEEKGNEPDREFERAKGKLGNR